MCSVVSSEISRRVLRAIVEAYPLEKSGAITNVDISQGTGNVIHVDIVHCSHPRNDASPESTDLVKLRTAISDALKPWNHTVRTIELVR
jgi:hypothetical protein